MNELHDLALKTRRLLEDYVMFKPEEFGHTPLSRLDHCCGIAAWLLCRQLWRVAGVDSLLVYGDFRSSGAGVFFGGNHCWTEVNGLVVDLTLTQYASWYRPVEIMPIETARSVGYMPDLVGAAAWDMICCWDPGPLFIGRAVARFIDRRMNARAGFCGRHRPRVYGARYEMPGALSGEVR